MRIHRRRALAPLCASLLVGVACAIAPNVAGAQENTGYVEICKTFNAGATGAPQYQGTFNFNITDSSNTTTSVSLSAVEGGPQACTAPIAVATGTATVTEVQAPWFSVSGISATPGDPGTVTPSATDPYTATVTVNPAPSWGDTSMTTTVQYTNDPVTGVIEVCKQADPNSPQLSGTYTFNVTSTDQGVTAWDSNTGAYDLPWTTTASATISSAGLGCSGPIVVPAGTVETVEPGTTYVTDITASSNGSNQLTSSDLNSGTADASVSAGDTTNQTVITYTDALSAVKLCKAWVSSNDPVNSYPFTLTSSGPAGPTAVTGSVSLAPGQCSLVGFVRPGTQVNITEGVVVGTKVAAIDVSPQANSQGMSPIVPGTLSLPNRTVSVIAGAGETNVTFTNGPADPGQLKICVNPMDGGVSGGTVPFLVNGTQMLNVNLSSTSIQCTLDPSAFAFNSSVSISGGALPGPDSYAGTATVVPTSLEVLEGGMPTATNQAALVSATASTATVLMSEGIVTEVTFSVDPPAPITAPTVTSTPTVAQVAADSVGLSVINAAGIKSSTSTSGSVLSVHRTVKPAVVSALIHRQVSHLRSEIRRLEKRLASRHLSKAARRADRRRLSALRRQLPRLLRELK